MGNTEAKLAARKAFIDVQVTTSEKLETTIKWNDLYDFNTTKIQDVFELMPDKEVRLLRDTNPSNLSYLVEACVHKLAQLTRVEIQNETTGEVFGLDFSQPTAEDFKRILNILRIVTRLLPLFHEDSLDNDFKRLDSKVYLKIRKVLKSLLFFPGFTLPKTVDNNSNVVVHYTEKIDNYYEHIWAPGIGYCRDVVITSELLLSRIECLRLVLLLLQIDEFCDKKEPELDWCLPFFTSLVNSIFTASITWSVNTLYGAQLDYINYILTSLNLLITRNEIFSEFSGRLNCDQDYEFILNGICALLKFDEGFCEPLATFLWNILSVNASFANFFVKQSANFNTILTALLLHLYSSNNQNYNIIALQTMFYLSTSRNFCIRLNKDFLFTKYISVYTNYKAANLIPNFQGTFFDFIIITLGEMKTHQNSAIKNGKFPQDTASTTNAQSTANYFSAKLLVNSSYFVKNLSMTASNIFFNKIFARDPSFTILFVANLLQFQFDTNSNFVFSMISHKTSLTNDRVPKNATVKKSMDVLIPQMEQLHKGKKVSNEQDLLGFLQNCTLIGLLPQRPNVELFPFSKDSKECKKWSSDYVAKFLVNDFEPDIPSLYVDFQRVGEVV